MADAPVYGDQKVLQAPLPSAHFSVDAPLDAFGGGQASQGVFAAAKSIGEEGANIALEERKKADSLAFLAADKQLSELETGLQVETSKMLGKDAFGAPDHATTNWKDGVDEIMGGLANDQQKNAVLRSATSRWESLNKNVQLHVRDQRMKLDDEQTKGYIETSRNAAVLNAMDDDRLDLEKMRQDAAVTDWANRNGIPVNSDAGKAKRAMVLSQTYRDVISQRLTLDQDAKAKELFDNVKDQMTADDQLAVTKALEAGTLRGESQRQSDSILAKYGDDRTSAMEEVRKIDDPKLRDAVDERVQHGVGQFKQAKAEARDKLFEGLTNKLDKNKDALPVDLATPAEWSSLSMQEKTALNNYHENNAPNDNDTWLTFLDLGANKIGSLSKSDFITNYWSKFDANHRNRAESMWQASKQGDDPDLKLTNTLNFHQQVSDALELAKIIDMKKARKDWSDDTVKTYVQFETNAAKQVELFERTELGGKRHASPTEVQGIIEKMVKDQVFVKKHWDYTPLSNPQKPIAGIREDEKGLVYMPIDKIPPAAQNTMKNWAQSKGYKVTRDQLQRAYATSLLVQQGKASDKDVDDILGGRK